MMAQKCSSSDSTTCNVVNLNLRGNIESLCGPEKLIICVDAACLTYDFKKVLLYFLKLKNVVNRHEIAVAVLTGNEVSLFSDFESEVNAVSRHLRDKKRSQNANHQDTLDLSHFFSKVYKCAKPFQREHVTLRVIFLYARVDCMPIVEEHHTLDTLRSDFPYFTLDVLYMPQFTVSCSKQQKQAECQKAKQIFESFINMADPKSYLFPVEKPNHLLPCIIKLLAHPALRESQKKDWLDY